MNIAIIPARGGSKRIPGKNIKPFCGRPMISYAIDAAINSKLFERIIVSTDDKEIATVAREHGAEVPFVRPAELADDFTGTNDVVRHAIDWLQAHGEEPNYVCCIYPTTPFLQAECLRLGRDLLGDGYRFALSVTSFPAPIQRSLRVLKGNGLEAIFPEAIPMRSQDLEQAYHDAGQFYWGAREAFTDDEDLFGAMSAAVILPRHLVQDIDTAEDWHRAELMYKAWQAET